MAENKVTFTDNELKSIAVNAMGRSSEAGNQAIMRIGLAIGEKYLSNGTISYPKDNGSGFTVGVFQWDIGANKNGKEFVEAYNNSSYVKADKSRAITDTNKAINLLQQNRDRDLNGEDKLARIDIRRDNEHRPFTRNLNEFFTTDEGYKFVMSLQERQYEANLKPELEKALNTQAVQNMSREDAVATLAAYSKLVNQNGSNGVVKKSVEELLKKDDTTKDKVIETINNHKNSIKEIKDGVTSALKGADLYNTLSKDTGKLGEIFQERNKENPLSIESFRTSPDDQLIDAIFRQPDKAQKFIEAVNNNKDYTLKIGKNDKDKVTDETYVVGVKNGVIFTADKNGYGYRLENDSWKAVEPPLRFGDKSERVQELQNNLNTLIDQGYLKSEKLNADGNFGQKTQDVIIEFKTIEGIKDDSQIEQAVKDKLSQSNTTIANSESLEELIREDLGYTSEQFNELKATMNNTDFDTSMREDFKSLGWTDEQYDELSDAIKNDKHHPLVDSVRTEEQLARLTPSTNSEIKDTKQQDNEEDDNVHFHGR